MQRPAPVNVASVAILVALGAIMLRTSFGLGHTKQAYGVLVIAIALGSLVYMSREKRSR